MIDVIALIAIFGFLVLLAAAFVSLPILRASGWRMSARMFVSAAVALSIVVLGGGLYVLRGVPVLALRALSQPKDVPSLIAALARRVTERPSDPTGWILLGRGYLSLGDAGDAAAAFRRAIDVAPAEDKPALLSAYGEALTVAASGHVTDEALAAFHGALASSARDPAARYYLGLAGAQRGDSAGALGYWKPLLAEAPANAPWRGVLLDRIAALQARAGQAPDIAAMVASLAARLKGDPNDAEGWQRLIRAYSVLGQTDKAHAALVSARAALRNDAGALADLKNEAVALKLE